MKGMRKENFVNLTGRN